VPEPPGEGDRVMYGRRTTFAARLYGCCCRVDRKGGFRAARVAGISGCEENHIPARTSPAGVVRSASGRMEFDIWLQILPPPVVQPWSAGAEPIRVRAPALDIR